MEPDRERALSTCLRKTGIHTLPGPVAMHAPTNSPLIASAVADALRRQGRTDVSKAWAILTVDTEDKIAVKAAHDAIAVAVEFLRQRDATPEIRAMLAGWRRMLALRPGWLHPANPIRAAHDRASSVLEDVFVTDGEDLPPNRTLH